MKTPKCQKQCGGLKAVLKDPNKNSLSELLGVTHTFQGGASVFFNKLNSEPPEKSLLKEISGFFQTILLICPRPCFFKTSLLICQDLAFSRREFFLTANHAYLKAAIQTEGKSFTRKNNSLLKMAALAQQIADFIGIKQYVTDSLAARYLRLTYIARLWKIPEQQCFVISQLMSHQDETCSAADAFYAIRHRAVSTGAVSKTTYARDAHLTSFILHLKSFIANLEDDDSDTSDEEDPGYSAN